MEAYPLQWPDHQGRTPSYKIQSSRFHTTFDIARKLAFDEIKRLGGRNAILSTNIPLRRDGLPYASAKEPEDSGIAVYFEYKGRPMVFACDKWRTAKENIKAVAKTIEAIRGIERWGSSEMMEQAFRGFEALPAPDGWRTVLGFPNHSPSNADLKARFRELAMQHHPDHGGDVDQFKKINDAYHRAVEELGF